MSNPYLNQPPQPGGPMHPGYGAGMPAQTPAHQQSRTWPIVLIVLGALMMIFGPLIGAGAAVTRLTGSIDASTLEDYQLLRDPTTTDVLQPGSWTIISGSAAGSPDCTVTDDAGNSVPTRTRMEAMTEFELTSPGSVEIDCGTRADLYVLPTAVIDSIVNDAAGLAAPFIGGLAVGAVGLATLVVGIVWLVSVNRKNRPPQWGNQYPGYPYPQQTYPGSGFPPAGPTQPPHPGADFPPAGPTQPPYSGAGYGASANNPTPPSYGQQPENPPRPTYGQRPEDPPLYGERIDPER